MVSCLFYKRTAKIPFSSLQDYMSPYTCQACQKEINHETIFTMVKNVEEQIKKIEFESILPMIRKLEDVFHPNNYLIMELKQKFVDNIMEKNNDKDKKTLEKVVDFIKDIIKVNNKIDPGLTVTLGSNLKYLNTAMLRDG